MDQTNRQTQAKNTSEAMSQESKYSLPGKAKEYPFSLIDMKKARRQCTISNQMIRNTSREGWEKRFSTELSIHSGDVATQSSIQPLRIPWSRGAWGYSPWDRKELDTDWATNKYILWVSEIWERLTAQECVTWLESTVPGFSGHRASTTMQGDSLKLVSLRLRSTILGTLLGV